MTFSEIRMRINPAWRILPVCLYRCSEPSILPWWPCWTGVSSVSPTAPPSLVECKHWGGDRPQAISGGNNHPWHPGLSLKPKRPTFDRHWLRSGCCQERRTQGCCRPHQNHRSKTCPRHHTRCCSPWGPRGLHWDSTCLGHINQDSNYAHRRVKSGEKRCPIIAMVMTQMTLSTHGYWLQRILTGVTSVFWEDKKIEFQSC